MRTPIAPFASLTLRAHHPAPARVELVPRPAAGRALRAVISLVVCWGSIPFLLWFPPHYPWLVTAFILGPYLAVRSWTGRYRIRSFAGICPRCGSPLSLGVDRTVDLPHTLTCFSCHFEPRLEVRFAGAADPPEVASASTLSHNGDCVGRWEVRWLADEPFLYCALCHGGAPAGEGARAAASAEDEMGELLDRLTGEGGPLI